MEEESVRASKVTSFATEQNNFDATNIPQLAFAIKSPDKNIQIPSLKHILDIVVNKPESIEAVYENDIVNILNKLLNDSKEGEILSNAIMNVIGLRSEVVDAVVRARAATEPLIQIIHSPNEKQSKQGSKALSDLVADNETIRSSLLTTGFAELVLHTLTSNNQIQSKSSSSSSDIIPIFIKVGLLDVVLRLVTTAEGLQPLALLIPILEDLKQKGENELKNKSKKILTLLQSEGINSSSSQQNDEDLKKEKEQNIRLREELEKEKKEKEKEKSEKERISKEFQKEKNEKERITEELQIERNEKEKKNEENKKIRDEIEKIKQKEKSKVEISKPNIEKYQQPSNSSQVNKDFPIAIINNDPSNIEFTDIDGVQKKIVQKNRKMNTFSLVQVLESGIWQLEVVFEKLIDGRAAIGIVRDSYVIPADAYPYFNPHTQNMVAFTGKLEMNYEKGTLTFFIDGEQQPVYISAIREKIHMYNPGSTCIIRSLKKLSGTASCHVAKEKAIQWFSN
ncbi:MAG: hypothetical protein EZS28_024604 [Streblomastix strix]|uniref:Uncharacterized protein n=1 Tax=Streblomastix strix TaxID=222440 RepID=A0A5J4VBF8_9EUKA|nr:MAG: hypothetical protein EZS28_024604 [Streblomastix strix]